MELPVVDTNGQPAGTAQVSDFLFGAPMNAPVVHQALVRQRNNARQGTSNTRTRGDVAGGGAKPFAQKHTGRARQGSIRAPQFRHGGIAFGPHPRSYHQRMPRKMRRLALRCMLSDKARSEKLLLLQDLAVDDAKTQAMVRILDTLGVATSALIVTPEPEMGVVRSARNIPGIKTLLAANLNVQDLLAYDRLVMTVAAVRRAEAIWAPPVPAPASESGEAGG